MKYAKNVLEQAQSWLGCKESDGSHRKIIDIYNGHKPLARGYAVKYGDSWCATFVSAVAIACGYTDIIPTECGCQKMIELFKKLGCWVEADDYVPKPGDVCFYDWDDSGAGDCTGWSDHVGYVETVEGNTITLIEGNRSNRVKRCTIEVNGRYIRGYGVPEYDAEDIPVPGEASTGSVADEKTAWNFLKGKGLNDFAVAGIMGNLYAESGLRSDNLENTGNKKLNLTDEEYTDQIDAGQRNFIDSHGYGLAQWTYSTRKKALLNFAKAAQKSICDYQMQLDFLWKELSGSSFRTVMNVLKAATSVRSASDVFMEKFENPADQSEARKKERASFGLKYYNKYASAAKPEQDDDEPATAPAALKHEKGDIVEFKGGKHFSSSNGSNGSAVRASKAKITDVYPKGKHPYHCRAVNDAGKYIGGVYGWVDEDTLTEIVVDPPKDVTKGCKVTIAKGATYGGLNSSRGTKVPYGVYAKNRKHTVGSIKTHKGVLEAHLKEINSWVPVHFLTVV